MKVIILVLISFLFYLIDVKFLGKINYLLIIYLEIRYIKYYNLFMESLSKKRHICNGQILHVGLHLNENSSAFSLSK